MTLTDKERHDAYRALEDAFGSRTDNVIAMLRPETDLVTDDRLAVTEAVLRADMADLRTGLRGEMADLRDGLRGEMADLRDELRSEMADLRDELRGEMAQLRIDVKDELAAGFQHQNRTMIFTLMGAVLLLILAETLRGIAGV